MWKQIVAKLKRDFPTDVACDVFVADNCEVIEAPDGSKGFGVYVPIEKRIYIAGRMPEPRINIPWTLAHEYMHFLQDIMSRDFDEDEADEFADWFTRQIGLYGID